MKKVRFVCQNHDFRNVLRSSCMLSAGWQHSAKRGLLTPVPLRGANDYTHECTSPVRAMEMRLSACVKTLVEKFAVATLVGTLQYLGTLERLMNSYLSLSEGVGEGSGVRQRVSPSIRWAQTGAGYPP